jgi:hypothetical protein
MLSTRLLENGIVTPKASAGVSRDTSPVIPHGETPSGAVVLVAGTDLSGRVRRLFDRRPSRFAGEVEISMESLILAQDERWRRA